MHEIHLPNSVLLLTCQFCHCPAPLIELFVSADMQNFHLETEKNLNKTINTLKKQIEDEEKEKKAMTQDKQALQSVATSLDDTNHELKTQVHSDDARQAGAAERRDVTGRHQSRAQDTGT